MSIPWIFYLTNLPLYIALAVGIILAANQLSRHPGPARTALLGLVLLLVNALGGQILSAVLPARLIQNGMPASQIGPILAMQGVVHSILNAGGISLLIAAVFAGRNRPQP